MLCKTVRAVAIVTALFLCPSPSKGMEHCTNEYSSYKDIEKNTSTFNSLEDIKKRTYKTVNQELRQIVLILQKKLRLDDSHVIKSVLDQQEYHQCKLAALSSPLISGNGNKPLRDDLRTLLYKPWTDPYYGEHLSQKDFTLLSILKDAIAKEAVFEGQKTTISALETLLSLVSKDKISEQAEGNNRYRDLFLRRRLDEINKLFARCGMKESDGIADLSSIPGLSQQKRDGIRMTLSKAYSMHMLKKGDLETICDLLKAIFSGGEFQSVFDTYAQHRLLEVINELTVALNEVDGKALSAYNRISHSLNAGDLIWLQNHEENLKKLNGKSLSQNIDNLKNQLGNILNREEYLNYLPLYRDHPLLRSQHNAFLRASRAEERDTTENWVDLFTELSQLKISLNSLGNGRDRSVIGFTEKCEAAYNMGAIEWSKVPDRIFRVKGAIEILQSQILQKLEFKRKVSVKDIVEQMDAKYREKRLRLEKELNKGKIWILAMDGGGVRGKIAAEILRDLSHRLKKMGKEGVLSDIFSVVTGTSVGGLIALALNIPDENGQPALDEDYIANLLEHEKASIIFPTVPWYLSKTLGQGNSCAYGAAPPESLLFANFGYTPLSDMRKSTSVMAHSTVTKKSVALNSCDPSTDQMTTAGCAQSTTAAPTYFPPKTQCYAGKVQEFIDGGLTDNNPVYEALVELYKRTGANQDWVGKRINILSIGTGHVEYNVPHGSGGIGGTGIFDTLLNGTMPKGSEDAHKKAVLHLGGLLQLGAEVTYYRLNPQLDAPIELDSASEENIAKLRTLIYESILSSPFYEQLVKHLAEDLDVMNSQYIEITGKESDQQEDFINVPPYLESTLK